MKNPDSKAVAEKPSTVDNESKLTPAQLANREYAVKKVLEYVGMSKTKVDELVTPPLTAKNQKVIDQLNKQIEASGLLKQDLTEQKIKGFANNIIGQIGRGNFFDYKGPDKNKELSHDLKEKNVKAFKEGQKIREMALGKKEEERGDFDDKIINAISHQSDQKNRGMAAAFGLRFLEVAGENANKAGGKLFGILDSKIALGVILILAMTIALGPAGPLAAAPLFGYLAYRVADKVGIVDGVKNGVQKIFKGSEKPLENSVTHSKEVMNDINQNQTKEIADLAQKYEHVIAPQPTPTLTPQPEPAAPQAELQQTSPTPKIVTPEEKPITPPTKEEMRTQMLAAIEKRMPPSPAPKGQETPSKDLESTTLKQQNADSTPKQSNKEATPTPEEQAVDLIKNAKSEIKNQPEQNHSINAPDIVQKDQKSR